MLFNTFQFVWMFPIIFLIYYGVAMKFNFRKAGNTVLLIVSYGLYLKWKPIYALVLLWVTAITYVGARFVSHKNDEARLNERGAEKWSAQIASEIKKVKD